MYLSALDEEDLTRTGVGTVDFLKVTPSHTPLLALLPPTHLPKRQLMFGGEALSADLVQQVRATRPELEVINHYGPTEATVGCLDYRLPAGHTNSGRSKLRYRYEAGSRL